MAIAFARVSIHSRSKGHSAVAAASYRSATKLLDNRIGKIQDYSKRPDVVYTTILLPQDVEDSFLNREFLWNALEAAEKRKDAQLCKDLVLALPKELNHVQQIELTQHFAKEFFVNHRLPVDIAIHDEGNGNPHAHLLIPLRRLEKTGFSKYKARDLNPSFAKGKLVEADYWGQRWAEAQNIFFKEKNLDLSVDPNHILSERHHGKFRKEEKSYLYKEHELLSEARKDLARENPRVIIKSLTAQFSVFTRRDVEKLVFKSLRQIEDSAEYLGIIERVMSHKYIVHLGENEKSIPVFTTRQQYLLEKRLEQDIQHMLARFEHACIATSSKNQSIEREYSALSEEQKEAFQYLASGSDFNVIIGRPGTGKTYLLKPLAKFYKQHSYELIGAALSAKVAKALEQESHIKSSTIASLIYRLNTGKLSLQANQVLIIDEAGMVDVDSLAFLIKAASKAGSKVILLGDPDQLKPIHKGEIFRGITSLSNYVELEQIKRQEDVGDRKASIALAKGKIDEALDHYSDKNAISFLHSQEEAIHQLIDDWQKDLKISPDTLKENILLAFTRKAVNNLNEKAHTILEDLGFLEGKEFLFEAEEKTLKIRQGERLLLKQNEKALGVRNGDLGTVKLITSKHIELMLDSGEKVLLPLDYKKLDYGYALTVHKVQGLSVDKAKVLIDSPYWDRHLSFVAMTRHRQDLKLYINKDNHPNLSALKEALGHSVIKKNVLDWTFNFSEEKNNKKVNLYKNSGISFESIKKNFQEKNKHISIPKIKPDNFSYEKLKKEYPILYEYENLKKEQQKKNGYFAEKIRKKINKIMKNIQENKSLIMEIKKFSPKLAEELVRKKHELIHE